MMTRNRQQGMTFIGWLILLGMLGFLVMMGLRLLPAYLEYMKVSSTLEGVASESTVDTTTAQVRQMITARFQVNDVRTVSPRDIIITRERGTLTLTAAYEYRTPLFANVEAVVVFDKTVEAGGR